MSTFVNAGTGEDEFTQPADSVDRTKTSNATPAAPAILTLPTTKIASAASARAVTADKTAIASLNDGQMSPVPPVLPDLVPGMSNVKLLLTIGIGIASIAVFAALTKRQS